MKRVFWLAVLGLFSAFVPGARAEVEKSAPPKPIVVLIGPGEFSDNQIKPHPTAEADAKALYDLFTDKAVLGVEPDRIHLLISGKDEQRKAQPATRENIVNTLKKVAKEAGRDDLVIIAIIGQGASAGERACVFASDSTFKDRSKNAFFAADIEDEFKNIKTHQMCVLVDLNFKGFDPGKEKVPEPSIYPFLLSFLGAREKDEQTFPPGRALILAHGVLAKPVVVDNKLGVLTKASIDALRGAADVEGYEPDGLVTVDELVKYLDREMPPLARKFGKGMEEQQQAPFLEFAKTSHFPLTKNAAQTAKVEARVKKFDDIAAEKKFAKEAVEQGRELLTRMPKLKALQELRKEYQKLADGGEKVDDFLKTRTALLESMKLARDAANSYAVKVMRGLETVESSYVKKLELTDLTTQAIRGLYRRLDARMPNEIKDRLAKAKDMKRAELVELLTDAREPLGRREDLDSNKDVEMSLQMAMSRLDPYSTFIDRESVERANQGIKGFFSGIGVQIRPDLVRDGLLVVTPIKGSPAYKAGLKAGDLITGIRRKVDSSGEKLDPPQDLSTKGMKIDEAVKLILGKPGTEVELTVQREGEEKPLEFKILRGRVEVETVLGHHRNSDDNWDYYIDPKNRIAYIYLTQFARNSFIDMEKVVRKLDKEDVQGLILDLRFDPGGYLDVARDISDLFIDDGLVVTIRERVREAVELRGKTDPSYLKFPMVVLVNGGSASGSEIVAACLQDHNRAVVMGERSYGKGSVQNIKDFGPTGGEIKLTTATFWRPSNKNLNKSSIPNIEKMKPEEIEKEDWGVRPDPNYTLKLTPAESGELYEHLKDLELIPRRDVTAKEPKEKKEFKDKQLEMAVDYLRSQIKMTAERPEKK